MEQHSTKVLKLRVQTSISQYFLKLKGFSKSEKKALKDMVFGLLVSKSIFINQIAAILQEKIKLKDVAKRLSKQYLKDDFWEKATESHLCAVSSSVGSSDYIIWDGTDISKPNAKHLEGLEFVRNGDTKETNLGYNVLNINAVSPDKDILPLYSKAYSFEMGAKSEANEIKEAANFLSKHINHLSMWVLDRGADSTILKSFFIKNIAQFIIRLKKSTKLTYKGEDIRVDKLLSKVKFAYKHEVTKVKKNKRVKRIYEIGILEVSQTVDRKAVKLHLVVTRNNKGGVAYFLVKSIKETQEDIAKQAFKGYGLRWSIEEYHRHIKQEYKLEAIQMRTFTGLQSMLAVMTIAMSMIYYQIKSIHIKLLLDTGLNLLNKNRFEELINFFYYKISKIISFVLTGAKVRHTVDYEPPRLSMPSLFGNN
jgi:hypothetical protein